MAGQEGGGYPCFAAGHWWMLRKKFGQTMPRAVTVDYLAASLDLKPASVRNNALIATLVRMGLLDTEGRPTDLATRWRDDEQYTDVCATIRQACYPPDLLDAVPDPTADRVAASRWFANRTGAGASLVGKMVALYTLLTRGMIEDPKSAKGPDTGRGPAAGRRKSGSRGAAGAKDDAPVPELFTIATQGGSPVQATDHHRPRLPTVHLDVQVHIAADASAEQIDQFFKSMAKHLYGVGSADG